MQLLKSIHQEISIDFVFFLAFDVGGSTYLEHMQEQFVFLDNNMRIMINTFYFLESTKIPFIFASSQMSTMIHSNYGLLKLMGERLTESLKGLTVTFWNIYGFESDPDKYHVISDFIRMSFESNMIQMKTDGQETRDFLYVEDCNEALEILMAKYDFFKAEKNIHISSGNRNSIYDVALAVASVTGAPVEVGLKKDQTQEGHFKEPSKFIFAHWKPKVTLIEGVRLIAERMKREQVAKNK